MGAYDNPRIIQPPNYTEIFMKNFAIGQATVEKAFAAKKAKKKERETKLDRAYQDTSKIRVKGQSINAGDMTANVRKQANLISDDFYANELAYIDEKIDRQTYQANRDKHLSKLQGMVDIGTELGKVDLENIKVSRHQADKGYSLGLIEAYNNQAVDIDYSGDTAKLYYMNPNNERVEVDLNKLKNIKPEDFGINEVFDFNKETLTDLIKPYADKSFGSSTINLEDGVSKVKIDTYSGDQVFKSSEEALAANKQYETDAINAIGAELNGLYNNLGSEDRGSLFADKAFASFTNGKNENNTFQEGKEQEIEEILSGVEGMTDETIKHVKEQILNGTYNGTDEQLTAMDEVSKTFLARKLFNDSPSIKKPQTDSAIASAKQLEEAARREEIQKLTLKEKKEGTGDDTPAEIKPFEDYVKETYGPTQTGTEGKRVVDFLTDYNSLGLSGAQTPKELIDKLKPLSNNQLGVQKGGNPYANYTTVNRLRGELMNDELKRNYSNGSSSGRANPSSIHQTLKFLENKPGDQIIILPTGTDKRGTYFYIGNDSRNAKKEQAFRFIEGDGVNDMVEVLKDLPKFNDVDPDVLFKEVQLYKNNPNRFKIN